jgi:hypothetical protein
MYSICEYLKHFVILDFHAEDVKFEFFCVFAIPELLTKSTFCECGEYQLFHLIWTWKWTDNDVFSMHFFYRFVQIMHRCFVLNGIFCRNNSNTVALSNCNHRGAVNQGNICLILSLVWGTVDGVWIGNQIYWTPNTQHLTTLYKSLSPTN